VRARANLAVEIDGRGQSVIRRLHSAAPLCLIPASQREPVEVRLVNSAACPLGGDDLELTVTVGAGARLRLSGVAATLALPGQRDEPSRFTVRFELGERARVDYLPEPTVVTCRARHEATLHAELAAGAELCCREVIVLGRDGERPGRLTTATHVLRAGRPVLRQRLELGDPVLDRSVAHLAGHRVLATELTIRDGECPKPAGGDWWSRSVLAGGGSLVTVLAGDAVTAQRRLELARTAPR
jgi:urease accessory protein